MRDIVVYHEDNFGYYTIEDDPEELAFYVDVRLKSRSIRCRRCKQRVRLLPGRFICSSCCVAMECGGGMGS